MSTHLSPPVRQVSCRLEFEVSDAATIVLQVAASAPARALADEQLIVTIGGVPPRDPVVEVATAHGGRAHVVRATAGLLEVRYAASVGAMAITRSDVSGAGPPPILDDESLIALRQSRYCPSDALVGFAAREFASVQRGPELPAAVASWVFERLTYVSGSSGPLHTAIDTLVASSGVCRDFAHLTIALCRALGVPARLAAVYAPGLSPMDFHAVVETRWDGDWEVVDPTRMAPRSSLVRIATGRDAADTAISMTVQGEVQFLSSEVAVVVEGDLPTDDHRSRAILP